jgi:hypothetical protein
LAQVATHVDAGHARENGVQEQKVGHLFGHEREACRTVAGVRDSETLLLQLRRYLESSLLIVVDDEDLSAVMKSDTSSNRARSGCHETDARRTV